MRCHIVQLVKAKDADLQGKSQEIIYTPIHKTFRENMGSFLFTVISNMIVNAESRQPNKTISKRLYRQNFNNNKFLQSSL